MGKASSFPTPLLRVSRPVSACQRCRGAKIKCDGKLPACTACEKAGRSKECSSANDHFAKGKERSYVTSLETQIETLERRVAQAKNEKATIDMLGLASAAGISTSSTHSSSRVRKSGNQEASNVDDLVSDFGFLSVNATARDFHGFTGEMSFARLVLSMSSLEPISTDSSFSLAPRYLVTPLIQHYIENIHVLYPFISETSLFRSVDKVFGQDGVYASPIDHWITLMVVAVSHASRAHSRSDPHYQEALKYTAAAFKYVEQVIRPGSWSGIQAMLLLVLLAMWLPHHYNSWYLIGIASRASVDLGLHQDPPYEVQARIKSNTNEYPIFDCVYSLDRYISIVHRHPFSFTEDSINLDAPDGRLKMKQTPPIFSSSLKIAEDLVRLRRIQSTSYQTLFQSESLSLQAAWPIMHAAVHEMAQWYSLSSTQDDQPIQTYYRNEVLYAIFLTLTPSCVNSLSLYGRCLLLQYAMEYADCSRLAISHMSKRVGLYTSLDLQRISFVAKRFLTVLKFDHETLCSTLLSTMLTIPPEIASLNPAWPLLRQPLFSNDAVDRLGGIYQALENFDMVIENFCSTYGYADPLQMYRTDASTLKSVLDIGT